MLAKLPTAAADGPQQWRRAVLRHEVAPRLSEHYGQGMGSYKDLLALAIATLAVVISLVTVVLQQRQQKRQAYRGLYEMLMSEQLQRGRWLIGDTGRTGKLPEDGTSEYYEIYRTLGVFEALAMYNERKVVPRAWVMEVWHHSLRDMKKGAQVMRDDRLKRGQNYRPWPNLWPLLDEADGYYNSDMLCCNPHAGGRARSRFAKAVRGFRRRDARADK
jgi:hypothetical protein